jgi:RimJ/RimL family protein N-acetyltransferase/catechol 2,3-dioxygenase-like lactoylglutathione lyase family enzyme
MPPHVPSALVVDADRAEVIPVLETERLLLTPYCSADADALFRCHGDADTLRYWHRKPAASVDELRAELDAMAARDGEYAWCIRDRSGGEPFGRVDCNIRPLGDMHAGYIVRRDCWGKGYATEAARAMFDWAFGHRGIERVELWVYEGNERSVRVAEKLGCSFRGAFTSGSLETGVHTTYLYGVTAGEWGVADPPTPPVPLTTVEPVVTVADVALSLAWYTSRLGFSVDWVVGDPPMAASVSRGRWHERAIVRLVGGPRRATNDSVSLVFSVPDGLDRLFRQYQDAEVAVVQGPRDQPWGMREFAIADPDGLTLRFAQIIARPPL